MGREEAGNQAASRNHTATRPSARLFASLSTTGSISSQALAFAGPGAVERARAGDDAADIGWFTIDEMMTLEPPVVPLMLRTAQEASALVGAGVRKESDAAPIVLGEEL